MADGKRAPGQRVLFWHPHSASRLDANAAALAALPPALRTYALCASGE